MKVPSDVKAIVFVALATWLVSSLIAAPMIYLMVKAVIHG